MRSTLFPGLDSLVELAQHGVDVKPTLLRVLTDLYVQKPIHTSEEERQFVELTLRLIGAVDPMTRETVARRLAEYPGAPSEIVRRLADEITNDRESNAASQREKSRRTGEPADAGKAAFVDVDASAIGEQFLVANSARRAGILAELDACGPLEPNAWPTPTDEATRRLEASALAGRPSEFIRELERALGIARKVAEAIVNDGSGEPLLVAAKALAIPIDVLQRILLFVNPSIGRSIRRVYALSALYGEISPAAALRLVASWHAAGRVATTARRGPSHSRSEALTQRGRATNAPRRQEATLPTDQTSPSSSNDPVKKVAS